VGHHRAGHRAGSHDVVLTEGEDRQPEVPALHVDVEPGGLHRVVDVEHPQHPQRRGDRHQPTDVLLRVGGGGLPPDAVALGLVEQLAVRPDRLGLAALELPVADLGPVVGGVAVGLGHERAGRREEDGLLERGEVPHQPRRQHQEGDPDSEAEVASQQASGPRAEQQGAGHHEGPVGQQLGPDQAADPGQHPEEQGARPPGCAPPPRGDDRREPHHHRGDRFAHEGGVVEPQEPVDRGDARRHQADPVAEQLPAGQPDEEHAQGAEQHAHHAVGVGRVEPEAGRQGEQVGPDRRVRRGGLLDARLVAHLDGLDGAVRRGALEAAGEAVVVTERVDVALALRQQVRSPVIEGGVSGGGLLPLVEHEVADPHRQAQRAEQAQADQEGPAGHRGGRPLGQGATHGRTT